jgi:serine phosphatase RsbU (regulator of sigma subunit)
VAEELLAGLLAAAHELAPDALAAAVAQHARTELGADAVVYLVDYGQACLQPLTGEAVPARDPLDIDTTLGGRAFRLVETLEGEADNAPRLWVPLLDGTERLGVLELVGAHPDDALRERARSLAALVAELVVSKGQYGDALAMARRREELTLAAEMQWSLLPPLTAATPHVVVSGMLEPSYDIGGDTFDYGLDSARASIAIFDAMGHGLPAAVLASAAVAAYRHSRRCGDELGQTYARMDEVIASQYGPERFVTAQFGQLELATGRLCWINAGHPAPLLVRRGRVIRSLPCAPTLPAGLGGEVAEVAEAGLEPGDRLLFFTDGVVEARSPDGEFFGLERLADLLARETAAGLPTPETVRRLTRAILAHQEGALQDDATTLLLEWRGPAA